MRRHLALASLAVTALAGAHALAGAPSVVPHPALVAPDGHGLSPQFASLADTTRVARRTAADGRADALAFWGASAMKAPAAQEGSVVGRLGVGMATFWQGGYVAQQVVTSQLPTSAACEVTHCWSYRLVLTGAAYRLRVGIDTPSRESSFTVELIDASGTTVGSATNDNRFNTELFLAKPAKGTYTVRVVPRNAAYAAFRLRAKAEAKPVPYAKKTALLPNLQATPPYEFGFVAPANPLNGLYPPDTVNPPLDVLGEHPVSCAADESVESGAKRCLRLTTGPRNAGAGPMDLAYFPAEHGLGLVAEGPVTQYVHWSDGSVTERAAGTFLFHKTHAHYHYQDILDYSIYSVGSGHRLTPAGRGTKSGFSPADQLFADWSTFSQEDGQYVEGVSSSRSVGASTFGLSVGWGDVYRWQRPGQYVEFAGNGDGLYVVRTVVDIKNHVLESNEKDNAAYAYVQITGDSVRIIERGQGTSPWDPNKKVFTDR
ncbi:MAG: hypothetical protein JWO12_568 [Frankiales bacterium]|nr:hypothetical protein [Frankiales bacterium]